MHNDVGAAGSPALQQTRAALSLREACVVFAAFLAGSVVLTLPLALHPTRTLPSDLVDTLLNTWIIGWDADRLRHGLQGLWDAPIYFPYRSTLAFSENLLGVAWFVAPIYWISGNAVLTYNVAFLLSFTIAGFGMYLLVRDLTGSRAAAAVAGTFYAFCPFRFAQISHIQMVCTGWLPIALWAFHRYFEGRGRGWLAVTVAASALQALSNTYVAYFMAVPLAGVAIDGLVHLHAHETRRRTLIDLAVAAVAVAVLLAPVGAAYYRVRRDYQQVRSQAEIVQGGADVRAYLVTLTGVWRPWLPEPVFADSEKELFPGFIAPLLALAAIWTVWKHREGPRRWIVLYSAIALAGFVLSLGPQVRVWGTVIASHGPYEWLQQLMPGMGGMRVPSRFAIICVLGLAVVAGCGAALLLARLEPRHRPFALAVLLVLIVADGWAVPLTVERYPGAGRPQDRAVADWLRGAPPGAVLHLPIRTNTFQELNYQYVTLRHGHPTLNGFSGYNTPLQDYLRDPRSPLYDYERFSGTVEMLRRLGIRFVVLHPGDYSVTQQADGEYERTLAGLRASGQVTREERVFESQVFELDPWRDRVPDDASTPIPPSEFTLSASEESGRLSSVVDGDPDTRWIGRQEGSSWLEVHFAKPRDVAQIELLLARRSVSDFPRELQIDALDDAGQSRVLYRSSPYPEFIVGFVRDPAYPRLDVRLPPNRTKTLSIREVAVYHDWWWSIHELGLRERSPLAESGQTRLDRSPGAR